MKAKLAALFCLIGLSVVIFCPSICAAKEASKAKQDACCSTQSHSQHSHCSDECGLHTSVSLPDQAHFPQLEYVGISIIQTYISCAYTNLVCTHFVAELMRPPDYLIYLKTIRIQC